MTEKLSKQEWQEKVKKYHEDVLGNKIDIPTAWWVNSSENSGMQLTRIGLDRFIQAKIELNKYKCHVTQWSANITLGLVHMLTPYHILVTNRDANGIDIDFYLCDPEYEMLLIFMDKDLSQFAKGFLNNEVV